MELFMATRRATRKGNDQDGLQAAMEKLIQNQAQFVAHLDEFRQTFSRIKDELAAIKTLLLQHYQVLKELPEAIRQKIGFKPLA